MIEGIIYKYTSPSGKVYIGQTKNESKRKRAFKCLECSYGGKAINNARAKYIPENFLYEVLEVIKANNKESLQDLLDDRESYYISYYKSNNPKYGYNETTGGQNAANYGMLGKNHSYETKQKIAEKLKNDQETIQRCIENGMKTAISIKAYKKDTGEFVGEYESIGEAARQLNINKANLAKCVSGNPKYKSCKGYIFKKDD